MKKNWSSIACRKTISRILISKSSVKVSHLVVQREMRCLKPCYWSFHIHQTLQRGCRIDCLYKSCARQPPTEDLPVFRRVRRDTGLQPRQQPRATAHLLFLVLPNLCSGSPSKGCGLLLLPLCSIFLWLSSSHFLYSPSL